MDLCPSSEYDQDDLINAQSHETEQTVFLSEYLASKIFTSWTSGGLDHIRTISQTEWVYSSLQDKDTVWMVSIISSSSNTDGGQVTNNLSSRKNLSQGILEFFHAWYFVTVLEG